MAWVPVAQAVARARLGPLAPKRIETLPAARLRIIPGMKNAEMRRTPFVRTVSAVDSSSGSPPIPEPM